MQPLYDAILFDLLTALVDSWSLWNRAAGDAVTGRRWRQRYLEVTYAAGSYRPYEELVMESAALEGLAPSAPLALLAEWDRIAPWPEAPAVLRSLGRTFKLGVVTNCSNDLAARAVASLGVPLAVLVAAERAGAYKPDPRPYQLALRELGVPAYRVLFVAGSPSDIPGAMGVGMPVVWHNRLQLQLPTGRAGPLAEIHSLRELPGLVTQRVPSGRPTDGEFAPYARPDIEAVPGDDACLALRSLRDETLGLFATLSDEQITGIRYATDKWTLKEVLGHLADDERIFAYRALCIARGDARELPGFDEVAYMQRSRFEEMSLAEVVADYRAVREASLTLFEGLSPEGWHRRGVVNGYEASVRGLAFHIAGHESRHLRMVRSKYLPMVRAGE